MNFTLDNFQKTGISWPYKIKENSNFINSLEQNYHFFQNRCSELLRKEITLKPNLISKFFDRLCFNEEIIENVKKIIGENVYIWSSTIFSKAPGSGKIVSFHQDNPYWQLTTNKVITAWIALTASNESSGCMQIVPGSSNLGTINKLDVPNARSAYVKGLKTTEERDMLSYKQDLNEFLKKNKPVPIELNPGEYSIHHVNTVHGSGVNESKNYRIGFAIRYISSDTQHQELKNDYALHVCGKKNDYFFEENRPSDDFLKSDLEKYEKSMKSGGAFGNKKY